MVYGVVRLSLDFIWFLVGEERSLFILIGIFVIAKMQICIQQGPSLDFMMIYEGLGCKGFGGLDAATLGI